MEKSTWKYFWHRQKEAGSDVARNQDSLTEVEAKDVESWKLQSHELMT